jgi:hypothetical protein
VFNERQEQSFGTEQHIGGHTARNRKLIRGNLAGTFSAIPDGNPVLSLATHDAVLHFPNQSSTVD